MTGHGNGMTETDRLAALTGRTGVAETACPRCGLLLRKLVVELTGAGSKSWKQRFEGVVAMLGTANQRWGEVRVTRNGIEVADVAQGSEEELHHFLETVALQVNAEMPQEGELAAAKDGPDEEAVLDRRMTAAFRSFADE